MTINITNKEADALTRKLAKLEKIGLTQAIVIAMREALDRRLRHESPRETAARLRSEFGIELTDKARRPLDRAVFDKLSGDSN